MTQNTSTAVMQRRSEPHDSLDDFPTPPWGTRALCEKIAKEIGHQLSEMSSWDPAANRGYMTRPLAEYFAAVRGSDIHDYGAGYEQLDFLWPGNDEADWIISNPPFRLAEQFIYAARNRARRGVAMLCRSAFAEGVDRYEKMFSVAPPTFIWQFVERLPMVKGKIDPAVASATAYAWFVWVKMAAGQTTYDWIAPCRKRLERSADYVVAA